MPATVETFAISSQLSGPPLEIQ